MTALILAGENAAEASRILKKQGVEVSERTIRTWRDKPDYLQLRQDLAPQVRAIQAANAEDMAAQLHAVALEAVELTREQIANKQVKDASAVVKNLMLSLGINVDKALTLRGQPTVIHGTQNVDDLDAEIRQIKLELLQEFGIDPETINLEDADVVEAGPRDLSTAP
jgi:hypothetical protein